MNNEIGDILEILEIVYDDPINENGLKKPNETFGFFKYVYGEVEDDSMVSAYIKLVSKHTQPT